MKKTLALLIAVLMIVAMLPMATLIAAAETPEPMFAVYKADGTLVGEYDALADADAALQDGYTLKVLGSYTFIAAYTWGATRKGDDKEMSYTIEGVGDSTVTYTGTGTAWTFGVNCYHDQITLKNIQLVANGGAVAVAINNGVTLNVVGGKYEANGTAVMRTVAGTTANGFSVLNINGGEFILNPSSTVTASDAVITNSNLGHVYINGGVFVNNSDTEIDGVRSEYVLKHASAKGDFQISSAAMYATAAQKGFFSPANSNTDAGVAIPMKEIPIVAGVTSKRTYEFAKDMVREYYYTTYGAGELVLVPSVVATPRVEISATGEVSLVFVTPVDADLSAAFATWARGKIKDLEVSNSVEVSDRYIIEIGTLIATEAAFLQANGVVENVENATTTMFDVTDKSGAYEIHSCVNNVNTEDKSVRYVAVPFIKLSMFVGPSEFAYTESFYGEFHIASGIGCVADAAAAALRDVSNVSNDVYQYPSIMPTASNGDMFPYAFSRFSETDQQTLLTYLAHEHQFNYQGECDVEECEASVATELEASTPKLFYTENGTVSFFKLPELDEGVSYAVGFSKDIVDYQVYDPDGQLCTVTEGIFTAAVSGDYYVRVVGKKVGGTEIAFSHIHVIDPLDEYKCALCPASVVETLQAETAGELVVVKGNTYFFAVELQQGVAYSVRVSNGAVKIYNEVGEEQVFENNVLDCVADGTYYIELQANYTGKAVAEVAHIHNYGHMGICDTCDASVANIGVTLNNVYQFSESQRVFAGDTLYFNVRLQAGVSYKIVPNRYIGTFKLYNEAGDEMTLTGGASFTCEADGVYYIVVNVLSKTFAQLSVEASHGDECTYNNKGECVFTHVAYDSTEQTVSCGKNAAVRLEDGASKNANLKAGTQAHFVLDYAAKGVKYTIKIAGDVDYVIYAADGETVLEQGTASAQGTEITYMNESDVNAVLYVVLTNNGENAVYPYVQLQHEHVINYRGRCDVMITTAGKAPFACSEKQLENTKVGETVELKVAHYAISLAKDTAYQIGLVNAQSVETMKLYNASGEEVAMTGNTFTVTAAGTYYLWVEATPETDAVVTMTVSIVPAAPAE